MRTPESNQFRRNVDVQPARPASTGRAEVTGLLRLGDYIHHVANNYGVTDKPTETLVNRFGVEQPDYTSGFKGRPVDPEVKDTMKLYGTIVDQAKTLDRVLGHNVDFPVPPKHLTGETIDKLAENGVKFAVIPNNGEKQGYFVGIDRRGNDTNLLKALDIPDVNTPNREAVNSALEKNGEQALKEILGIKPNEAKLRVANVREISLINNLTKANEQGSTVFDSAPRLAIVFKRGSK